jgi:chromosome segregation ATPase
LDAPQQQCQHEFTDDEYRQLEKEFARLEHEYDDAMARIANLEEDLTKAKEDLTRAESQNQEKDKELLDLQQQLESLDSDHKAVVAKAAQLQEELEYAQEQATQAKLKRDQREADLWDVIDQYKKLSEENEHTVAKMQGVENQLGETQALVATMEQELALTKRHNKRNDLVYDNMKIKQTMEDCKLKMEELERDLKTAKADAARYKEDSKTLRNRLAGSNFQFTQLKAQYGDLMSQKTNLERSLDKAQRQIKILKTPSPAAATTKVFSASTKQETNEEPNQYLRDEISELHAQSDEKVLHQSSIAV